MRREHAQIPQQMKARWRHERAQPRDEILRREHDRVGAVAPRFLEAVDDVSVCALLEPVERERQTRHVAQHVLEPVERERRTRHVAQHVLEALAVTPVKRDLSVDVDAADLSERAVDRAHGAHGLHELERALAGGVADELHVSGRGRVAGGKYRLIVRQLSRLVAEAVERAAVRAQHANNARVRPRGNLLHLLERRRAERVKRERAALSRT